MTTRSAKGQAPGQSRARGVQPALPQRLRRPGVPRRGRRDRPARGDRLGRLPRRPQGAAHAQGRPRLRRSRLRPLGRVARDARAPRRRRRSAGPTRRRRSRVLVICGSPRNDGTCPGEISKTFRLAGMVARGACRASGIEVDFLDLSLLTSEYGRHIHPCKGCVSTAMPLCHWPCSCYPNHSLRPDQRLDERDLRALGRGARVVIVTPVHWYQTPEPAQADDRPPGLRRRRQSRPDLDRTARIRRRRRRSSSTAGTIRSTSPAASTASWCTATSPASRARAARCPTGSTGWAWSTPATRRGSTATSATTSRTRPATTTLDRDAAVQEEMRNVARAVAHVTRALRRGELRVETGRPAEAAAEVNCCTATRTGYPRGLDPNRDTP